IQRDNRLRRTGIRQFISVALLISFATVAASAYTQTAFSGDAIGNFIRKGGATGDQQDRTRDVIPTGSVLVPVGQKYAKELLLENENAILNMTAIPKSVTATEFAAI